MLKCDECGRCGLPAGVEVAPAFCPGRPSDPAPKLSESFPVVWLAAVIEQKERAAC